MKLYYTQRSPYARKARVAAFEKGIKLTLEEVDLARKSAAFLRVNPVGKIPALQLDDGRVLADSSLICEYLDALQKNPPLVPLEARARLDVLSLDMLSKGLMDTTVSVYMEKLLHPSDPNTKFIAGREETIVRCLDDLEKETHRLEALSLASIGTACAIGYIIYRAGHLWPRAECPRLTDWFEKFSQRESMQKTIPVA